MRILFVSECYPDETKPQYCIYLEQQAKALQELGHTVDILIPTFDNHFEATVTECCYNNLKIFKSNIPSNKFSKILSLYRLPKSLKNFDWKNYDAVSFHIVTNGLCSKIVSICKKYSVPIVNHFHGLNVWKDYYFSKKITHTLLWGYNQLIKMRWIKKSDAIVGVSNKVCDVVKTKLKHPNIFTVYNGVDFERFPQKETPENDVFTILCVANLISIKGHDYLIEAVSKIKAQGKKLKLNLIGIGPLETELKDKCLSLGLQKDVEFLGTQSYEKVSEYMRQSDMFIMPSYFEALGCVYLEAMSSKTLTCGCYDTGADEIIDNLYNGLLVRKQSTIDIYNAILFAMENPEIASKMAENGVLKAHSFSWEASAKALENIYKKIVNN